MIVIHPNERLQSQKMKHIFALISQHKQLTKQELMDKSGLTSTTLTRVLEDLSTLGMIRADEFAASTGGRPPIIYRINRHYGYLFGLDISRATSKIVLCDGDLNIIDTQAWMMDEQMTPARLLPAIARAIVRMIEKHNIDRQSIIGLGIGAVGPLEREKGLIMNPQHFAAEGWEKVEICRVMQQYTGLHCILDNGANTAILAEYWLNNHEAIEHLLYVHAGVGIRSAIIVGGEIVYGAVDMEGAAGQMIIHCDDPHSSYRSWESFVSSPNYFGVGLANMLNILHPQKVILGGPVITHDPDYYEEAIRVALHNTYHAPTYQVIFEKSQLGEDAVALGAAVLLMKQMTAT